MCFKPALKIFGAEEFARSRQRHEPLAPASGTSCRNALGFLFLTEIGVRGRTCFAIASALGVIEGNGMEVSVRVFLRQVGSSNLSERANEIAIELLF